MNYHLVASVIEIPEYREKDIKKFQTTNDIIKELVWCFKNYHKQARPAIKYFRTGSFQKDAHRVWRFIRENIRYNAEPEKMQTSRSFSRIIYDKWGDCKHSALLAASLGYELGYNIIFRFVAYGDDNQYGHVYTILENPKTGEKKIVDPLQNFNFEKPYTKRVNYKAIQKK